MTRERRYELRLNEDTLLALRRMAILDERTMAAQLRFLIREEAMKRGVWSSRPLCVKKEDFR